MVGSNCSLKYPSESGLYLHLSLGFTFADVNSVRASTSKVICCHFSSDGKLLASGGHDKKVSGRRLMNFLLYIVQQLCKSVEYVLWLLCREPNFLTC